MKPREVISGGQKRERGWHTYEAHGHRGVSPKPLFDHATARRRRQVFIRAAPEKVNIKGQDDEQLGAITKSKREEHSCDEKGRSRQGKIESCSLSQQSKAESDLPCAAESEVAPR